ncbi:TIGR01177 family methyltransferase [Methanobacterium alcaliphilum]|uniref:TIGR01177 family methyltransferase n=1 Tax=Methanobacterium alcaliphilum TaxID=392018 RepID=UPI00200B2E4B|nr:TIGR01177 family methyltransferase [Methanobacterium alcaliphilum]MCK9152114.1 TIGR01177 family methyltransferase [Methanobacterium alcaliphilum]
MEIFLILSREHETLPSGEVKAVLEAEEIEYDIKYDEGGVMVIDSPAKITSILGKRMGYAHEICDLLFETTLENLEKDFTSFNWSSVLEKDFAVRVKKIESITELDSLKTEKKLGNIVKSQSNNVKVNLESPLTFIRILVAGSKVMVGKRSFKINKKHFYELKPHKRPFFYPGSMSPKLARCMVNLSRIKKGDLLMDPFCGTGGILIEAGIVGARLIGTDIDEKMVNGTVENLKHCGISDFHIFQSDARNLDLEEKVRAVVTDPPYGISASTAGEDSGKLYSDFLISVSDNMVEKGRICMATPHYVDVNELIKGTKFKILERHEIRMHKSLTRVISIMEKND